MSLFQKLVQFRDRLGAWLTGRRLLAIAWRMPPVVFPRPIQIARTLKALRMRGWVTDVVTVDPRAIDVDVRDERLASIYDGQYVLHRVDIREQEGAEPPRSGASQWERQTNTDVENAWLRRATRRASGLMRRRRFDALVTFAQPLIDHAIGLELASRRPTLPWIAHFSDPGVDSPYVADLPPERLNQWAEEERAVVDRADALVFVNRYAADLVMSKYPSSYGEKVFLVPHGYDHDLRRHIEGPIKRRDRLHIVHAGHFYGIRRADVLLRAIARAVTDDAIANKIEVTFAGGISSEDRQLASDLGIVHCINFLGPLPFLESMQVAGGADVLLVIDAPAEINVFQPSKISDYFLLEKPILGVTPQVGATADLLRRCGHFIVSPTDEGAIAQTLRDLVHRWTTGRLQDSIRWREAESFDIRNTTGEFERAILAGIARRRGDEDRSSRCRRSR